MSILELRSPSRNIPRVDWRRLTSGEGILTFFKRAQRCAMFVLVLTLALAGSRFITETSAAGAFAIGKCRAYDYAGGKVARAAALKHCKGQCTMVTMKRACAALAVDMANPCGAHGYAVKPRISSSLNEATRKCYESGGKECVIRAWACDAKG